jgi:PAS domain S-box-containing protein
VQQPIKELLLNARVWIVEGIDFELSEVLAGPIGGLSMSIEQSASISPEACAGTVRSRANLADPDFLQLLYEFSERWQRATSLDEVYEAALDAICGALHCPRASILLFDPSNRMRFVAWRGLSESYRTAVDGHSPWTRETKNPQPVLIDDVNNAGLSDNLQRIVRSEGIRALAFIPLVEHGLLLGKFMIYYDNVHRFSDSQIDLAWTIARQLGFSVERMRAAQTAAQLAAIVESSDDAIISKDLNGVIQTWNRGAERIFGYTAEEVIGKPVLVLIPPDRHYEEVEILARLRRGEKLDHFETIRRRKDGSLFDISLTVSPICDATGQIVGASKIARDISDRKRAEQTVKDSERRLQELMAAIPAAIYTTDAEGKISYYNEAVVEFAGRRPTIGSDEWCVTWKLYNPDGTPLPHDQCPMAIALKEGRPIRNAEAIAERPDGTRIPFIPYPTPLRDSTGKVIGAVNMLIDVSERKQAEANQRMLLAELNHRVKNNMQAIQSLLQMAAGQIGKVEPQEIFREASRRIAAMCAAQRILYRTNKARHFDAREFVSEVCNTAQAALPANVKITFAADDHELSNDAAMPLALILNELVTNAAKHGAHGEDQVIRVRFAVDGNYFIVSVVDDGPGFDFDAVRPHTSGLRLVQGLARQLRGTFQVSRNPTCCSVQFPQMS